MATISTLGIMAITGIEVSTALQEGNSTDDQLAKIMVEIKNARKDSLVEVKTVGADVLNELNALQIQTSAELKSDSASTLEKVDASQNLILAEVKTMRAEVLKELRRSKCIEGM